MSDFLYLLPGRRASSDFRSRMLRPGYKMQKSYPIPLMVTALCREYADAAY
jgi:hypothetical protein